MFPIVRERERGEGGGRQSANVAICCLVAAVQDLHLYVSVQGREKDTTADFTVWLEPPDNEGPLPGINGWSGVLVLILIILLVIICAAYGVLVFLRRDRLSGDANRKERSRAKSSVQDYDVGVDMAPLYADDVSNRLCVQVC